jgi:hypothetical protein
LNPITSQKAAARAKRDLAFIDEQLADLKLKREATNAGYDQAQQLLEEQRHRIGNALQAWNFRPEQLKLAGEA